MTAIPYSRCPGCWLVVPPAWMAHDGTELRMPLTVGCANCGTEYTVTRMADLIEDDTVAYHGLCRTQVPCPATAHLVRCETGDPPILGGCGAVFPGPAAGAPTGPPPPPPDSPVVPRRAQEPCGWPRAGGVDPWEEAERLRWPRLIMTGDRQSTRANPLHRRGSWAGRYSASTVWGVNSYAGAATLVLPDGIRVPGQVDLHEAAADRMRDWVGTFTSADSMAGQLFDAIGETLRIELRGGGSGEVVLQSFGGTGGAVIVSVAGSGNPPF